MRKRDNDWGRDGNIGCPVSVGLFLVAVLGLCALGSLLT